LRRYLETKRLFSESLDEHGPSELDEMRQSIRQFSKVLISELVNVGRAEEVKNIATEIPSDKLVSW
jgi:hypothetical protein